MAALLAPSAFLDANVLFSAAAGSRETACGALLDLCRHRLLHATTSAAARDEAERNCQKKLPPNALSELRQVLDNLVEILPDPPDAMLQAVQGQAHDKDLIHLATAVQARCLFLVTKNVRHYHPRPDCTITVYDPEEVIRRIRRALYTLDRVEFADPPRGDEPASL
ncbi:MAG: PIN domain-containing protein [Armatimonadetes bacterium]|nr:PIN domain-containing protein [Armatimonadota bacterium]